MLVEWQTRTLASFMAMDKGEEAMESVSRISIDPDPEDKPVKKISEPKPGSFENFNRTFGGPPPRRRQS